MLRTGSRPDWRLMFGRNQIDANFSSSSIAIDGKVLKSITLSQRMEVPTCVGGKPNFKGAVFGALNKSWRLPQISRNLKRLFFLCQCCYMDAKRGRQHTLTTVNSLRVFVNKWLWRILSHSLDLWGGFVYRATHLIRWRWWSHVWNGLRSGITLR